MTPARKRRQKSGIVSKGIREPVDRLTLFGGTFNVAILSKVLSYKHIVVVKKAKRKVSSKAA
jgi:hypothetical protein